VLKGSTRIVDPGILVWECDDFEYCDATSMTSQSHMTSSIPTLDAP